MFIHPGEQNMYASVENNMFGPRYFSRNPGLYSLLPTALPHFHPCHRDAAWTTVCYSDWPAVFRGPGLGSNCFFVFLYSVPLGQLKEEADRDGSPGELPVAFKSTITTLGGLYRFKSEWKRSVLLQWVLSWATQPLLRRMYYSLLYHHVDPSSW